MWMATSVVPIPLHYIYPGERGRPKQGRPVGTRAQVCHPGGVLSVRGYGITLSLERIPPKLLPPILRHLWVTLRHTSLEFHALAGAYEYLTPRLIAGGCARSGCYPYAKQIDLHSLCDMPVAPMEASRPVMGRLSHPSVTGFASRSSRCVSRICPSMTSVRPWRHPSTA